jgi:dienelactone hydrolase
VSVDDEETGEGVAPPRAEFDPGARVVPLPNAVLIDPASGRVTLPQACGEEPDSAALDLREALNELDGFGTSKANLVATFSEPVNPGSLPGRVFVLRLAERGVPLSAFEGPVEVDVVPSLSRRFTADCSSSAVVPNVTIRPRAPLEEASTYAVVFLAGIESESSVEFEPAATWALVRQELPPVTFAAGTEPPLVTSNATPFDPAIAEDRASLVGLDRLWRGHAPLLGAFDQFAPALAPGQALGRDDVLLAWAFETQTLSDPFDPAVENSPAASLAAVSGALTVPPALAGEGAPLSVEQFFGSAFPGVPCGALGCDAIGSIYAASAVSAAPSFVSPSFLQGDDCDATEPLATGPFSDPLAPVKVCDRTIPVIAVVPSEPPGASGYPTVMFGHGLGRSKEDVLAIAGALAQAGIASVAFDAVDHGARAAQVSVDAALGCDGPGPGRPCVDSFGPTCAPQCFAPILSSDLPATRDHLRQTVLDQLQLERVLQGCSTVGACGQLQVDPARIGYLGQSLGALIGGVSVAMSSSMRAAVLNVGGGDWVQVFTDTATPAIRCPLVDALIEGGVLSGEAWNRGANPNALCLGEEWKGDPRFQEFAAAARWVLDPVDAVNYAARYHEEGGPAVLLAEVVDDAVVPNSATLTFATLLGVSPEPAAVAASAAPAPTPAALEAGSRWIRYAGLAGDPASMFPGNAFAHGSLLSPASPDATMAAASGSLGTIRMQVDTLAFLVSHL